MGKFYQPKEVAKMIGVSTATIKHWESQGLIPKATRIGLNNRRVWHEKQVERILDQARDQGYSVPFYFVVSEVSNNEARQKETASRFNLNR